jgi:hypothetical protein
VLQTGEGKEIPKERFNSSFDEIRKERAPRFAGKRNRDEEGDASSSDEESKDDDEYGDKQATNVPEVIPEEEELPPSRKNILYVCQQIWSQYLSFLLDEVFPKIPDTPIYECLKEIIRQQMTYRLTDNAPIDKILPAEILKPSSFQEQPKSDKKPRHHCCSFFNLFAT